MKFRSPALILLALVFLIPGCKPPGRPVSSVNSPVPGRLAEVRLPLETPTLSPGVDGRLALAELHAQKYPPAERAQVRSTLEEVLIGYSPTDLEEATAEVLAFHHVVYHRTKAHDLEKNHAVAGRVADRLRELADRHGVPWLPVLAIISWENSGSQTSVSWADAAGLGQMTRGAVERAHTFAAEEAVRLEASARTLRAGGGPEDLERARDLEERARHLDLATRHAEMARNSGLKDERMVVEANLEDTLFFFKFLLQAYGGRPDLAISAYHNGLQNNDDILLDYLVRRGEEVSPPGLDRAAFLAALERQDVTWLDLWRDRRSRQMLNGLRTVEGEVTTPANARLALGDESDLYPWKVLASLAAFQAGPDFTARMVARYSGPWDLVEVQGLPEHRSYQDFEASARLGHLVPLAGPVMDLGIAGKAEATTRAHRFSYWVTPEMAGYLLDLGRRLREGAGEATLALPILNLSGAWNLGSLDSPCPGGDRGTHLRGVAVDLAPQALRPAHARLLEELLHADYVMDRVYLRRIPRGWHAVLNPRWGQDYQAIWERRQQG